ncbi:hypothetical protein J2Y67_004259 [Neobacillus niacini]|nr:hypothetical protein [Neobacillus niacini]
MIIKNKLLSGKRYLRNNVEYLFFYGNVKVLHKPSIFRKIEEKDMVLKNKIFSLEQFALIKQLSKGICFS